MAAVLLLKCCALVSLADCGAAYPAIIARKADPCGVRARLPRLRAATCCLPALRPALTLPRLVQAGRNPCAATATCANSGGNAVCTCRAGYTGPPALLLAVLATESLHGEAQTRLDAAHYLDLTKRACVIDAGTPVGRDLNRLFTGFLNREFGAEAFDVERVDEHEQELQEAVA